MSTKTQGPRHSLPPKPMVSATPPIYGPMSGLYGDQAAAASRDRCHIDAAHTALHAVPMRQRRGYEWAATPPFPTPALTTSSLSSSSMFGEHSPVLTTPTGGHMMQRSLDLGSPPLMQPADRFDTRSSLTSPSKQISGFDLHPSHHQGNVIDLARSLAGINMHDQQRHLDSYHVSSFAEPQPPGPLLIPMQPTGAGVPLTSVVETLASKGSKAAAEDPETVAAAYKLSQWGIGIGPGINPKVTSSRSGANSRGRLPASEPPIVNTGNSGPMCVQPGDWICTSCGFVNWRRREVCMRCFPHAEGNDIGRGIQGGEMLAKRLAAGLDPDTEEYRQSVQALCPDKVKRGLESYSQRMASNTSRATYPPGLGGTVPYLGAQASAQDFGGSAPNYLGVHLGPQVQQQWRQPMDFSNQHMEVRSPDHYGRSQSTPSSLDAHLSSQQSYAIYDANRGESSPYKTYYPDMSCGVGARTIPGAAGFAAQPEQASEQSSPHSSASKEETASRAVLTRSSTFPSRGEHEDEERFRGAAGQANSPYGTGSMTWTYASPESTPGLPKDIWAPAPKRPTLVLTDPEDIAREKRAKPQPIGTRWAAPASTRNGEAGSGPARHASLETA